MPFSLIVSNDPKPDAAEEAGGLHDHRAANTPAKSLTSCAAVNETNVSIHEHGDDEGGPAMSAHCSSDAGA